MSTHDLAVAPLLAAVGQEAVALLASGSAALESALEVLEIGPGHEVIVPDVGCHCVGAAVVRRSATPVFVAVGPGLTLTPDDVILGLSTATRCVICVHQYGLPCDVEAVRKVLPAGVVVLEDFAQAWGLSVRGRVAGSLGDLSVTSFGPTKPVSLGAGGALLGPSQLLRDVAGPADRARTAARPPSGARFPMPLLPGLPGAVAAADAALANRRESVRRILTAVRDRGWEPPATEGSEPSWTRLPLYPLTANAGVEVVAEADGVKAIQGMHRVRPASLPMFSGHPTRRAGRPATVPEPILVQPAEKDVS